jgi:hypothetical protein
MAIHQLEEREFVVPMRWAEALWLSFRAPWWMPHVLKVGIGGVDAVSGEAFESQALTAEPQDYVVVPDQPWLDGINAGDGFIRQLVAVPLGEGLTVEAQLTGTEEQGGLTLALFAPRPGRFPEEPPERELESMGDMVVASPPPMGLGAGGRMRQEIYADEYGPDSWEPQPTATVHVDLVDAMAFEALTGLAAPPPVADARTYTEFGLPWFDLYDPRRENVRAANRLAGVRSIADLEAREEDPLPIPEAQVVRLLRLRQVKSPR